MFQMTNSNGLYNNDGIVALALALVCWIDLLDQQFLMLSYHPSISIVHVLLTDIKSQQSPNE
jgi:hypothetical protein